MEVVTITNVRKFLGLLHQLPDTFQNSDISNIKEFPLNDENAIARVLSYFNFLGREVPFRKVGDECPINII